MDNDYFEYSNDKAERSRQRDERYRMIAAEADYEHEIELIKHGSIQQQEKAVIDSRGKRWIQCKYCQKVSTVEHFSSYGGRGKINLGVCYNCLELERRLSQEKLEQLGKSGNSAGNACPLCNGSVIRKKGRYGEFWECSNYPDCKFRRGIKKSAL